MIVCFVRESMATLEFFQSPTDKKCIPSITQSGFAKGSLIEIAAPRQSRAYESALFGGNAIDSSRVVSEKEYTFYRRDTANAMNDVFLVNA